jgi:hypothetical protein
MKIFEAALLANVASAYHIEPIYVMTNTESSSRDISRKNKEKEFQEFAR